MTGPRKKSVISRRIILCGILVFLNVGLLIFGWHLFNRNKAANNAPLHGLPSVVATVDGFPIFARDLLSAARLTHKMPSPVVLRRSLDAMIQSEIIIRHAQNQPVDKAEVEFRNERIWRQFADEESLAFALRAAQLTKSNMQARHLQNLRAETWLLAASRVEPTETEYRAWYDANTQAFAFPEVVKATHFAAIFPPRGTPAEILSKTDLIHTARRQLADGIPLPSVIETLSDDPAKKTTHGSLGWFSRERMEPALAEAAFSLPIGEVSNPVPTRFGFHLLSVSDRRPAKILTYEEARDEVRIRCSDELQQKKMREIISGLMQDAKIKILAPTLKNLTHE